MKNKKKIDYTYCCSKGRTELCIGYFLWIAFAYLFYSKKWLLLGFVDYEAWAVLEMILSPNITNKYQIDLLCILQVIINIWSNWYFKLIRLSTFWTQNIWNVFDIEFEFGHHAKIYIGKSCLILSNNVIFISL